ncbi:MAG: hypothetical protein RLZ07_247, partial [Pseudomonadota bacterium]
MAFISLHNIFRCALSDDNAAAITTFRPHIDDPVGGFDHFEIMFDDNDRVALIDKLMQHLEELGHVMEMEPRCRLVENIERSAGRAAGEFLGQFHALRFTTRERRSLLSDF